MYYALFFLCAKAIGRQKKAKLGQRTVTNSLLYGNVK
jgi:hypothetical protein